MKINFSGHELILHHSGMAFWPAHKLGMVSDLHLEKGSHFAARGFFLPPYDSQDTLTRLLDLCEAHKIERLIILGDSFHDPKGYERMNAPTRKLLDRLRSFDPIWIKGNHDAGFVPENFTAYDEFELDGISFRHQAQVGFDAEISGHFHPKINLQEGRLQRDCFITDGKKILMPAFGAYTGGLSVQSPEIKFLFKNGFDIYALGEERLYLLRF
jgi:DNA ligase-associated metallophosphoesterase